ATPRAVHLSRSVPPVPTLFPYTTLFRSTRHAGGQLAEKAQTRVHVGPPSQRRDQQSTLELHRRSAGIMGFQHRDVRRVPGVREVDRKSTRLNSSHEWISYAVFCLKKKQH